jgi:signal transduction histidine kinase
MQRIFFSKGLLFRLILSYTIFIIAVFSISSWFFYRYSEKTLEKELEKRLLNTAEIVASTIPVNYLVRLKPGDEDTPLHAFLIRNLEKIKDASKARDIFVFDRQNRVLLDADREVPIGKEYLLLKLDLAELETVWQGAPSASTLYWGMDGKLYKSGYAPIKDETGNIVAVVGIEAGAEFLEIVNKLRTQMLLIGLLSIAVAVIISFVIARSIVNPLNRFIYAIETEAMPSKVDIKAGGEIGFLAERFNQMVDKLNEKDRLLQAMYEKEKARADSISEMSASVAHEIRNPLGAITGFVELLENKVANENGKALIENIMFEIKNLNHIVTDFLSFAKKPSLDIKETDAESFLDSIINSAAASKEFKDIKVEKTISPNLQLHIDHIEMRKALFNIVINALQSMTAGGALSISTEKKDSNIEILISDTGKGIPKEIEGRIFDPFFTTKERGTGLGLAIAYKIIEAHKGTITFNSEEGEGTTFIIRLPVRAI